MTIDTRRFTQFVSRLLLAGSLCLLALPASSSETAGTNADRSLLLSWKPVASPKAFGPAPAAPEGPYTEDVALAVATVFGENLRAGSFGHEQSEALQVIAFSGDTRVAWILSDLMRIAGNSMLMLVLGQTANHLLGITLDERNLWGDLVDHLIAWDIPEPPNYLPVKRNIYTLVEPAWERIFDSGDIDWRHVSWGGVLIDSRAYDMTDQRCNCIPAADNPEVIDAASADWLDDEDIIFGVAINGEYRAYPRQIMEVREMVNDTLGGRDIGMPYCTLCGSAQAYFTDDVPEGVERPVLRTSGLLIRSNKVMYDLNTWSVFDTFRGNAVTGPLFDEGVILKQASVVTTTWGEWKTAHPGTTVLAERYALGRDPDFRKNRDANGPIFPIGDMDQRLPVHEDVLGVITESGTPVAFPIRQAMDRLNKGESITVENIRLVLDGGGVRAQGADGQDAGGHQAFWFAWSQFYPDTILWTD